MQTAIDNFMGELNRVIAKPPTRPIRLMLFATPELYSLSLNKAKERFSNNEIINISVLFESEEWQRDIDKFEAMEQEYGNNSFKFQRILCEKLEKYIIDFIEKNNAKKVLIIEDSQLYLNGFDPIHFLSAYMFDNYIILNKEVPIIWMTIGQKEEYNVNKYNYYKTNMASGRTIKITQVNFSSCIKDYKENY